MLGVVPFESVSLRLVNQVKSIYLSWVYPCQEKYHRAPVPYDMQALTGLQMDLQFQAMGQSQEIDS